MPSSQTHRRRHNERRPSHLAKIGMFLRRNRVPVSLILVLSSVLIVRAYQETTRRDPQSGRQIYIQDGPAQVLHVEDPITLIVQLDQPNAPRRPIRVRMLGIHFRRILHEEERQAAIEYIRRTTSKEPVHLHFDRVRLDLDGDLLAFVYVGDVFLNAELVRRNWAEIQPVRGATRADKKRQLRLAQEEAWRRR